MSMFGPPQWRPRIHKLMLDPVRSAVEIVLDDIVAALPVVGGTLTRLQESWTGAEICLVLDAADVQSGDPDANELLRSGAILNAAHHPQVSFRGHVARPAFDGRFEITGIVTFRDSQLPLTFDAQDLGERAGAHRISASATLRPPPCRSSARATWNPWNLMPPTAVEIVLHAEWLSVQDPMPAA